MKQARRKELKTNELSIYLEQIRDAAVRYSNYILGGIVLAVLILMIGFYVQSSRAQAESARWTEYREIQQQANQSINADLIARAERLAQETAADPRLGPVARELHAELAYQAGLDTSPVSNPEQFTAFLNQARESYQKLINEHAKRPDVTARARLGLAATLENLLVVGKAQPQDAAEQYRQVAESKNEAYADLARSRLDTLPERTRPLTIVATRPAETAPEPLIDVNAEAATEPAAPNGEQPAPEQPAAAPEAPAPAPEAAPQQN